MKYVVFENEGNIELTAIKTFGISVKESKNPIGFFGTGLKYAIAICLREEQDISIYSGLDILKFSLDKKSVRGKQFDIVKANDQEMPFTTKLGMNWEVWQAFREIYCNAIDEKGKVYLSDELPEPKDGKTFVVVEGSEFRQQYFERDTIVLKVAKRHLLSDGDVEVYNKPSNSLYYRGIRVFDFPKPAILTYNLIKDCQLTEDRTLKFSSYEMNKLPPAIAQITDRHILRDVLTCEQDKMESEFSYQYNISSDELVSDEFIAVIGEEYAYNNDKLNPGAREFFCKKMSKKAAKNLTSEPLTEVEEMQFERAKKICKRVFPDFDTFPIITVNTLGQSTHAMADMKERVIILAKPAFKMGTKYLVSTMIEEYSHLKTGYYDCSRQLQTYLFDTISTIIEDHVIKEPI